MKRYRRDRLIVSGHQKSIFTPGDTSDIVPVERSYEPNRSSVGSRDSADREEGGFRGRTVLSFAESEALVRASSRLQTRRQPGHWGTPEEGETLPTHTPPTIVTGLISTRVDESSTVEKRVKGLGGLEGGPGEGRDLETRESDTSTTSLRSSTFRPGTVGGRTPLSEVLRLRHHDQERPPLLDTEYNLPPGPPLRETPHGGVSQRHPGPRGRQERTGRSVGPTS